MTFYNIQVSCALNTAARLLWHEKFTIRSILFNKAATCVLIMDLLKLNTSVERKFVSSTIA